MASQEQYVVCLDNEGYKASLVARRIYRAIPDTDAAGKGLLRIVDESGEDYLFPADLFESIELSARLRSKLALG